MLLPFGAATFALAVLQAACVVLPRGAGAPPWLARLRGPAWAVIAPASIVVVIGAIDAASGVADGLTWLALVAVPPLAAVALGRAMHGARPAAATLAALLLAVAWAAKGTLTGDFAAALLTALSCVTLGWLLAAVTPGAALRAGVVGMAAIDAYLVFSHELQAPNATLIAATPLPGLPQLQFVGLRGASLGYGDLFVAGVFGAVVAAEHRRQVRAALLVLALATAWDLLFWVFDELPATVPVALALVVDEIGSRRARCAS